MYFECRGPVSFEFRAQAIHTAEESDTFNFGGKQTLYSVHGPSRTGGVAPCTEYKTFRKTTYVAVQ